MVGKWLRRPCHFRKPHPPDTQKPFIPKPKIGSGTTNPWARAARDRLLLRDLHRMQGDTPLSLYPLALSSCEQEQSRVDAEFGHVFSLLDREICPRFRCGEFILRRDDRPRPPENGLRNAGKFGAGQGFGSSKSALTTCQPFVSNTLGKSPSPEVV